MSALAEAQPDAPVKAGMRRRVLQRVVLPAAGDSDVLPLYLEAATGYFAVYESEEEELRLRTRTIDPRVVTGRRSVRVPDGDRISFGTYFNAFPAAYWRRWTVVEDVRLVIALSGPATVVVNRTDAQGKLERVKSLESAGGPATVDLSLAKFGDGGWYWFDIFAHAGDVELLEAWWDAEVPDRPSRTASISITTFNQPGYCLDQLRALGSESSLRDVVDRIFVVDQGSKLVTEQPDYAEVAALHGDRLRVIRQGNLGGAGGFARGMYETERAGESAFVLLMDDDVLSEPEGILRAVTFGDLARQPTLVGGHMFSMYQRTRLHALGEVVNRYRFLYSPTPSDRDGHDFKEKSLLDAPWLHRRADVDYNAWWMCLIPVEVVRSIGLALPVFIKWDDAEYGLRAKRSGFPTVTLPGAAVWHVPFHTKDDSIDWQAYYHQRNRWLAALLHSPYDRGGRLPRESFQNDVKHLLSLRYSVVELRLRGLEDLLSGPEHLHRTIGTQLGEIRKLRATFTDSVVQTDPGAFPTPGWVKPPRKGVEPTEPEGMVKAVLNAATGAVRQFLPIREGRAERPEAAVPAADAKWWRLSHLDSAVVSSADGSGASWYKRDPKRFREYLARSTALHQRLLADWSRLLREYQDALGTFTSPAEWEKTFEASFPGTISRRR